MAEQEKSVATPLPAATIMLLRDSPGGVEVFMVKRHHQIDFVAGALVFPGGRVDKGDSEAALRDHTDGGEEWTDVMRAMGAAAIREAFDESGILLARDVDTRKALYNASHNIKGQAATFEHPLIGRAATSLCNLMDECRGNALPVALVAGHIDAIHVFFRDNMKDADNPIANALLNALETSVGEIAAAYAARR